MKSSMMLMLAAGAFLCLLAIAVGTYFYLNPSGSPGPAPAGAPGPARAGAPGRSPAGAPYTNPLARSSNGDCPANYY